MHPVKCPRCRLQPCVGDAFQNDQWRLAADEELPERRDRQRFVPPVELADVLDRRGRPAYPKDHIIAEARQLVMIAATSHLDFDMADRRLVGLQGGEEGWIDDQLLLVGHVPADPLLKVRFGKPGGRLLQLDRGVERLQQRKGTDVADKHDASGSYG